MCLGQSPKLKIRKSYRGVAPVSVRIIRPSFFIWTAITRCEKVRALLRHSAKPQKMCISITQSSWWNSRNHSFWICMVNRVELAPHVWELLESCAAVVIRYWTLRYWRRNFVRPCWEQKISKAKCYSKIDGLVALSVALGSMSADEAASSASPRDDPKFKLAA